MRCQYKTCHDWVRDGGGGCSDWQKESKATMDFFQDNAMTSYKVEGCEDHLVEAFEQKNHKGDKFTMKSGFHDVPHDDWTSSIKVTEVPVHEDGLISFDVDDEDLCPGATRKNQKSGGKKVRCYYSDTNATGVRSLYNAKDGNTTMENMFQVLIQKFCKGKVGDKATNPVCKAPYITAEQVEAWNKRYCEGEDYNDSWCNCYNIVNERCGELPDSTVCKNSELPQELASDDAIGKDGYKLLEKYKHCRRGVCPATSWRPENTPECPAKVNICGKDWNLGTATNGDIVRHCVVNSGKSLDDIKDILAGFEQPGELGDWTLEKKPTAMEKEAFAFGQVVVCCCLCILCIGVMGMTMKK